MMEGDQVTRRGLIGAILAVLACASATGAFAGSSASGAHSAAVPTSRWYVSPKSLGQSAAGPVEAQVLQRVIPLTTNPSDAITLGNIVTFKAPRALFKEGVNPRKMEREILEILHLPAVSHRKFGASDVLEYLWQDGNRYIRVYITPDPKAYRISVASFRIAYMDSVNQEVEIVLRALAGEVPRGSAAWLDQLVAWVGFPFGVPEAFAQPCNCGNPPNPLCFQNCMRGQGSAAQLSQLDQALAGATPSIDGAANAVNNAANAINGANQTIQGLGPQIINQMQQANDTGKAAVEEARKFNEQFKRGVNSAEKLTNTLTDPFKVGVISFGAAAGAVLGGMAVNTIVDGISYIGGSIYEALTNEKDNRERRVNFQEAFEFYTKYKGKAAELEQALDHMNYYLGLSITMFKNREKLAKEAVAQKRALLDPVKRQNLKDSLTRLTRAKDEIIMDPEQQACVNELNVKIAEVEGLMAILDIVSGVPRLEEFCKTVREQLGNFIRLERALEAARAKIIAGMAQSLQERHEQDLATNKRFKDAIKQADELEKSEIKNAMTMTKARYPEFFKTPQAKKAISDCMPDVAGWHVPIFGIIWANDKKERLGKCELQYFQKNYANNSIAKERYMEATNTSRQLRANAQSLAVNDELAAADRKSMHAMFREVIMEQSCLNGAPDCKADPKATRYECCDRIMEATCKIRNIPTCRADVLNNLYFAEAKAYPCCDTRMMSACGDDARSKPSCGKGCCDKDWYSRHENVINFIKNTDDDIANKCGY